MQLESTALDTCWATLFCSSSSPSRVLSDIREATLGTQWLSGLSHSRSAAAARGNKRAPAGRRAPAAVVLRRGSPVHGVPRALEQSPQQSSVLTTRLRNLAAQQNIEATVLQSNCRNYPLTSMQFFNGALPTQSQLTHESTYRLLFRLNQLGPIPNQKHCTFPYLNVSLFSTQHDSTIAVQRKKSSRYSLFTISFNSHVLVLYTSQY